MWKEITRIMLDNSNHTIPTAITDNKETMNISSDIANIFNNCPPNVVIYFQYFSRFFKNEYFD